ncbi:SPOR domain-containing protein [Tenacibaculum sp. MAR_2009_124]|uniref:SPOR domain-containing protein n=1 Tax=Tenacibaculum sp. MAR_2009_124 TaxID=1250059 RepID=UPI000B874CD2|nr:SPOR domain-containing protein [Tenacibaculum sp. MAR_2009_124]
MKNIRTIFFLAVFTFIVGLQMNAQEAYNNTEAIKKLIEKKKEYNKTNKTGYLIQLYNGLERTAKSTRYRFKIEFPGVSTELEYKAPEWKVQVGNYKTRLEADRALNKIREKFSGAIVIPM